jgi:hypothetical protein
MSCQKADLPHFVTFKEKWIMKTHSCFPFIHGKGSIGIISNSLYVVTKSARNEILWNRGASGKWMGRDSSTSEVVVFFDGKVWSPESLPQGFDKSKSVVVSFKKKHIRFYDFVHNWGGYYERDIEN